MTSKKRSACSQRWSDLLMDFFSYQLPITQSKSNIVKISRYFAGRQTTSMKNFVKEHLGSQGGFICRLTYLIYTKVEIEPPSFLDKWLSPERWLMRIVILSFDLCFDVAGAYFPLSCFDSSESQKCTNQLQLDINQHMWMSSVFVGSAIIISRPSALQNNLQLWSCYVTVAQEVRIGFRPSIGNNMRLKYLFNRIRWLKNEYMYYVPNLSCLNLTYSQGNKTRSHIPS